MGTSTGSIRPSARCNPSINIDWGIRDLNQPSGGGLGVAGGRKSGHELAMCTGNPKSQPYPGFRNKKCSQQVKGDDFSLYSTLIRSHMEYCDQV